MHILTINGKELHFWRGAYGNVWFTCGHFLFRGQLGAAIMCARIIAGAEK